jgi:DNA-binding Lrp family transcriptional regulator
MENSRDIDLKDRRILFELDRDARLSCAQLGKRIGVSTEVARYRLKKLEDNGIIASYQTAANYARLGLLHFKICLRFNGIPLKTEEDIYSVLKPVPQIIWIVKCEGDWDCIISCTVETLTQMGKLLERVQSAAHPHLHTRAVSITTKVWWFPRSYLVGSKDRHAKITSGLGEQAAVVDETDIALLKVLAKDARRSAVAIAEETGLGVKAVTTRIKKMLQTGAINNFRLVIDYEKLGIRFYKTLISLKNPEERRLQQLIETINMNPNVVFNLHVIGEWSLEPEFEFENPDEFPKVRQQLLDEFSDIISDIRTVDVLKEYKYTFFHK